MRVAIFTNNYLPRVSGVSVAVNFLNTALKRQGHETLIVAPDYGFDPEVPGVHVERITSIAIPKLKVALTLGDLDRTKIRYLMRGFRPDIIHCHHPFLLGESAVAVADELGVPVVYTFHTLYEFFSHYFLLDTEPVRKRIRDFTVKFTEHCDLVITPTEPIKQYLQSLGVTARVEAVPTGIDFSRFEQVTPAQVESLRRRFGLARYDCVLLSVGRITKEKNVRLCLDTLAEMTRRGVNCALLMLGEGPEADMLMAEAKDKHLEKRMILGGFLDQETLAAAYFLGTIFLFPSLSDTQGIVLYEALAAGLPIVATDSMASRAAVRPGENGLFAHPTAFDFADKIEQILADRERFSPGIDTAAFSHEAIGQTYDRLYRETIEATHRPKTDKRALLEQLLGEFNKLWK